MSHDPNGVPATAMPSVVREAGSRLVRDLDVRPVLAKGGDPFRLIMKTIQSLSDDEALHLLVGFEPTPLYLVVRGMGLASHVIHEGDVVHVWFYRDGPSSHREKATAAEAHRVALQPPVELDVRGMEPPNPLIAILEKLVELGPGARLTVHHHREPVLLYDKLEARGYGARTELQADGHYLVHIAPRWSFEPALAAR